MATASILFAAAILYTGNTYQHIKEMMGTISISFFSHTLRESVQIRSFFRSVFSHIQSKYGKIRIRKNSIFGHFSRSDVSHNFIQRNYLFSAMHRIYTTHRKIRFDEAAEQNKIWLLGNGRRDWPKYKAKHDPYTIMESTGGETLDF